MDTGQIKREISWHTVEVRNRERAVEEANRAVEKLERAVQDARRAFDKLERAEADTKKKR